METETKRQERENQKPCASLPCAVVAPIPPSIPPPSHPPLDEDAPPFRQSDFLDSPPSPRHGIAATRSLLAGSSAPPTPASSIQTLHRTRRASAPTIAPCRCCLPNPPCA